MIEPHQTITEAFRAALSGKNAKFDSSAGFPKRTMAFIAIQTAKTIKEPRRISFFTLTLPSIYLRQLVRRILFRGQIVLDYMPPQLFPRIVQNMFAVENNVVAERYLAENQPETAWIYFRKCLQTSSDPHHFFVAAVCLMVGLGRFREASRLFAKANNLRRKKASALGLKNNPIRFLDSMWIGSFGHLAQTDYFIKAEIMAGRSRQDRVVYLGPPNRVANPFLFEQLRPHLNVFEHEADLPLSLESLRTLAVDFLAPRLPNGTTVHLWKAAADTYRRWQVEGFEPLYAFPDDVRQKALEQLQTIGMPRDAWFVTLHVRERSSKPHHADLHSVLDASAGDYTSAVNEITRHDGWVIRIGDPSMTPLPAMPNVLDYCHSSIRSDWMDIFLLSNCRFFLGTSSGPAYVPPIYGVPCVLTNWWPPAQRPWFEQDIFIPKMYRKSSGEYLSLSQSLVEPFGYCNSVAYLTRSHGVIVEDNSPIDIHAAVVEMLDRLESRIDKDESVDALRSRAGKIYESSSVSGMGQLARGFLKRHLGYVN